MLNIDPQPMAGSGKKEERLRQGVPLFKKKKKEKRKGEKKPNSDGDRDGFSSSPGFDVVAPQLNMITGLFK